MNLVPVFSLFLLSFAAHAATYQLGSTFSSDFPTVDPLFATGTLSYDATEPLLDGSYAWDSLSNLQMVITLGSSVFTEDDLITLSSKVYVEVRNGGFYFSNVDGYASTDEGAARFVSGASNVSFQPIPVGGNGSLRFAYSDGVAFVGGTYTPTAVPEPSAALLGLLGMGWLVGRRRRCV